MEKKIITISREFGSGGHSIGRMLADKLGIPFYDKEIVEHIALESGLDPNYVEEHHEHAPGKTIFSYAFVQQLAPGTANTITAADFLWKVQCDVIMQLADKGPCIIVGRNADYILKDREDCLHAFIHADKDYRAERIVRLYGQSEKSPMSRLNEKDKRRQVNYQHYTGRKWGDAKNYDICLNSGVLGEENCTDILLSILNK